LAFPWLTRPSVSERERLDALRESEARLRAILDSEPEWVKPLADTFGINSWVMKLVGGERL
jgi:hypothetical protein